MTRSEKIIILPRLLGWHIRIGGLFPNNEEWWQTVAMGGLGMIFKEIGLPSRWEDISPLDQALFLVALPWVPSVQGITSMAKRYSSHSEQLSDFVKHLEAQPIIRSVTTDSSMTFPKLFDSTRKLKSALEHVLIVVGTLKPKGLKNRVSSMFGMKSPEEQVEKQVLELLHEYKTFEEEFNRLSTSNLDDND